MHQLRRNPVGDVLSLHRRMQRFMNSVVANQAPLVFYSRLWEPALDVFETETELVVVVEIAGVAREDIEIALDGSILVISGERSDHVTSRAEISCIHQREIDFGRFERSIRLPYAVDPAGIRATLRNGFLEIRMAKASYLEDQPISVRIE